MYMYIHSFIRTNTNLCISTRCSKQYQTAFRPILVKTFILKHLTWRSKVLVYYFSWVDCGMSVYCVLCFQLMTDDEKVLEYRGKEAIKWKHICACVHSHNGLIKHHIYPLIIDRIKQKLSKIAIRHILRTHTSIIWKSFTFSFVRTTFPHRTD